MKTGYRETLSSYSRGTDQLNARLPRPGSVLTKSKEDGFSLVEVVLALGIVGFTVVVIFGLFPLGLKTALESRVETRAAYLGKQIIEDLRTSPFDNATILYQKNTGDLQALAPINLAADTVLTLGCDEAGKILKEYNADDYESGVISSDSVYLVQIKVIPNSFPDTTSPLPNISKVSVEVSFPAAAKITNRSRCAFFTLIGKQ